MRFSIIIPVYNVAPYLRECLGSIAAAIEQCKSKSVECKTEVEVICVDDGSTDGSSAILDEYAERSKVQGLRFKVIHQANQGVGAARNRGLEEATGEWVLFLDGDDWLEKGWIEKLSSVIAESTPELIRFGIVGRSIPANLFDAFMPQYLYRRDVIRDLQFKKYVHGEDLLYMSEAIVRSKKIQLRDDLALYNYRNREGSAVHRQPDWPIIRDEFSYRFKVYALFFKYWKFPPKSYWRNQARFFLREGPKMIRDFLK